MSRPAVLVDTAVLAYALGGSHPMKVACERVIRLAGAGELELHASVEMIQELLLHRMRKTDRRTALNQARDAASLCFLHDFDQLVLRRAIELIGSHDSLGGRDAVHAATALERGLRVVLSPDQGFDHIDGLRRVDPADLADNARNWPDQV